MNRKKLLILDDDVRLCEILAQGLSNEFDVTITHDPDIAYRIIMRTPPDILLFDVHLGVGCGIELCKKLRANQLAKNIPILMLTGHGNTDRMLQSYDGGADDYIEKPADLVIIKTRLLARLRRMQELSNSAEIFGNLRLHPERLEVELDGKGQRLSEIEFNLLRIFLTHPNKKITRDEILKTIWNDTRVEERTVDVHISSLRRKLKDFNHHIKALYGSGYILRPVEKKRLFKALEA
ncbi:MAG: response regulator transcription factor [Pseudobdellovibrio sp.]|nr:response regulator transcription factor [Pseudobdellovibrio sp.]